jgi:oxygen-independent coproporphyrinogen III oxidase
VLRADRRGPASVIIDAPAVLRELPRTRAAPRHLYVHVPFCVRRCSYCDFSIAVRRRVPVDEYLAAVSAELELRFPATDGRWEVDTLYLGGGTPSLLGGDGVARLLAAIRERVTLARDAEVTLEANPDDVAAGHARAWRAAGVTRLSIGAQSFDPGALAWMHRSHTPETTRTAMEIARDAGFDHLSLDLIFALPRTLSRSWRADLDAALALQPGHLSLYGLTVEPATPLGRWVGRGVVSEAPDEVYAAEYLEAHDALSTAGYEHYEVSNFAAPGTRSRHNSAYWSLAPYAGVGPAAHEYDGERRRWNVAPYAAWAREALAGRDPQGGSELLSPENRVAEKVYLELRTIGGTVLEQAERTAVEPWLEAGWALLEGARLRLTAAGWLRLDSLAVSLASVRSR